MTKALAIDLLDYAHDLEKVGVPKEQAEQHARLFAKITEDHLATKQDIRSLKRDLELKIAEQKNEVIKWLIGASGVQVALIISCIKLIH